MAARAASHLSQHRIVLNKKHTEQRPEHEYNQLASSLTSWPSFDVLAPGRSGAPAAASGSIYNALYNALTLDHAGCSDLGRAKCCGVTGLLSGTGCIA